MKRGDTPTKLNFTNKKSSQMPSHTQRRTQMGSRFDENINEEDSLSMSRSQSRERSTTEQLYSGNSNNFRKQNSVSPGRNDLVSPRFNQERDYHREQPDHRYQRDQRAQLSPRETFDDEEHRNISLNFLFLNHIILFIFKNRTT